MNKKEKKVLHPGKFNFLVKRIFIQKEKQSQKTPLIFFPHDWKPFLKYNIGCCSHSERIMLSLEEYVFDDCESSSTQGCQSKLEVWATGPTCKAPKTQINKHIGIAIADHTGSLSCQEFSSRLHVLYFPLSVSIEVNLGLGLDTKEQRFYFSIEDPFFLSLLLF